MKKKSFKHNSQFYIELCQRTKNGVSHSPKEKGKFQEDHKRTEAYGRPCWVSLMSNNNRFQYIIPSIQRINIPNQINYMFFPRPFTLMASRACCNVKSPNPADFLSSSQTACMRNDNIKQCMPDA